MYAHVTNMIPGDFVWTGGDTHLYLNHIEQAKQMIARGSGKLPSLRFARKVDSIFDFKLEDIIIDDYHPHPTIKGTVAV